MRTSALAFALAVTATGPAFPEAGPVAGEPPEIDSNEIFDPVELFATHCWDPLRLKGQFVEPVPITHWGTMTPQMRPEFGISGDPSVKAWIKSDWQNGVLIILEQQQNTADPPGPAGTLVRQGCRVTITQADLDTDAIYRNLVRLFNGNPGSDRPRDLNRIGATRPAGWDHRCWTVRADINDSIWHMRRSLRDLDQPLCLTPNSGNFYAHSQFIIALLSVRTEGEPLAVIEMHRTIREASYEALYADHSD